MSVITAQRAAARGTKQSRTPIHCPAGSKQDNVTASEKAQVSVLYARPL